MRGKPATAYGKVSTALVTQVPAVPSQPTAVERNDDTGSGDSAMTTIRTVTLIVTCSLLLGACATVPAGPSVTALPGTGKSFGAFQGDDVACRQWAAQQAGTTPQRAGALTTAEDAGIGTLLGAGLGAALGAIGHNPGLGAAVGAGAGLAGGTAYGAGAGQNAANQVQHRYDTAYEQCMYAKGNQVPGVAAAPSASVPAPPPASAPSIPPPPPPAR